MTAKEMQTELVESGLAKDENEAAHMMRDAGEINNHQHKELLSPAEADRCYG